MRHKALPLGEVIRTRHDLTANIEFNLYGDGAKEEGRTALAVRNSLDEMIFGATASDLVNGDSGGLDHLKRAIVMETIAERLHILEGIYKIAKKNRSSVKQEMANIIVDRDRFERFTPNHRGIMKTAASGSVFLATWRLKR